MTDTQTEALKDKQSFGFKPLSNEEKAEKTRLEKEVSESLKSTVDLARECLTSDMFINYKNHFKKMEANLITIGIGCGLEDPVNRATFYDRLFVHISVLRDLINEVEKDAR